MNERAPIVGLVIANHRTAADSAALAREFLEQQDVAARVVISDNSPTEADREDLATAFANEPRVQVVRDRGNRGYGAALNLGMSALLAEEPRAAHVFLSNADVELGSATLIAELLAVVREAGDSVAVFAPQVLTPDGRPQNPYRTAPLSARDVRAERLRHVAPLASHAYFVIQDLRYRFVRPQADVAATSALDAAPTRVFALHGSFLGVHVPTLEAAGLIPLHDEAVFLFAEELVVARRLEAAGLGALLVPHLNVLHREDAAQVQLWPKATIRRRVNERWKSRRHVFRTYY